MLYTSTRGNESVSAATAILQGIAPDGGLFVPREFPHFFPAGLADYDYQRLAREIFSLYLDDYSAAEIEAIVAGAYGPASFPVGPAPVRSLGDGRTEVLELWHGPTAAFKDLALQALPRLLSAALTKTEDQREVVILVATSGDTGKAALEGFKDVAGVKIIVFYPRGGVSRIQELQMVTTGGSNTYVVGVDGNFDDCQTGVKEIFASSSLARFSSANSINWGRLLPQIVYYFYAYAQMVAKGRVTMGELIDVCVPTGNFGNILAAWYARKMGLPVGTLLCASNENNVLTEALAAGHYDRNRPFYRTISPSMDILVSSNYERFIYDISGCDPQFTAAAMAQLRGSGCYTLGPELRQRWQGRVAAGCADRAQAAASIRHAFDDHQYLLDPHTAYGQAVAERLLPASGRPLLLVSTASPFKFPSAVLEALGVNVDATDEMALPALLRETSGWPIPANLAGLEALPVRHQRQSGAQEMLAAVEDILGQG